MLDIKERWDKLSHSIQAVNKDVENVSVTTDKITKKFTAINQVDIKSFKRRSLIMDFFLCINPLIICILKIDWNKVY